MIQLLVFAAVPGIILCVLFLAAGHEARIKSLMTREAAVAAKDGYSFV